MYHKTFPPCWLGVLGEEKQTFVASLVKLKRWWMVGMLLRLPQRKIPVAHAYSIKSSKGIIFEVKSLHLLLYPSFNVLRSAFIWQLQAKRGTFLSV